MTNCIGGRCDNCGQSGPYGWCIAPSPTHLHSCKNEDCRNALQVEAGVESA